VKKYRAVLFDLFGTVALFDHQKLPLFEWDGKISHSTMGRVRLLIEEQVPALPFAHFYANLLDVSRELGEIRTREMIEFSSVYRFSLALQRTGRDDSPATTKLAEALSAAHMALLAAATAIPAAHVALLTRVYQHHHVALVSNFDHGPTARRVLQQAGAHAHFHNITISAEHGWRKPHPKIFTDVLVALGEKPGQALFVGDSPHDDISGAKSVGMDVAWVNADGGALPSAVAAPDYIVRAIPELEKVLFSV
jgi:putative hydrolase of the HAD superfamily